MSILPDRRFYRHCPDRDPARGINRAISSAFLWAGVIGAVVVLAAGCAATTTARTAPPTVDLACEWPVIEDDRARREHVHRVLRILGDTPLHRQREVEDDLRCMTVDQVREVDETSAFINQHGGRLAPFRGYSK